MRILAFTDMHLSATALKKIKSKIKKQNPDLLVCAGDVTIFEEGLGLMLNKLNKLNKKILIIHPVYVLCKSIEIRRESSLYPNLHVNF